VGVGGRVSVDGCGAEGIGSPGDHARDEPGPPHCGQHPAQA
jgi:hypothetical protein